MNNPVSKQEECRGLREDCLCHPAVAGHCSNCYTKQESWEDRFDNDFIKDLGETVEPIFLDPNGSVGPIKSFIRQELDRVRTEERELAGSEIQRLTAYWKNRVEQKNKEEREKTEKGFRHYLRNEGLNYQQIDGSIELCRKLSDLKGESE